MSKFAKRKHFVGQMLGQEIDSLTEKQSIVKILRSKGNNLHEVESPDGESYLMSMPTKFRNVAYVKIGDYVLVESIDEGDKVRAEMVNVILPDQIPEYIKKGIWPERFNNAAKNYKRESDSHEENSNSDSDNEYFVNVNRLQLKEKIDNDDDETTEESDTSTETSEKED